MVGFSGLTSFVLGLWSFDFVRSEPDEGEGRRGRTKFQRASRSGIGDSFAGGLKATLPGGLRAGRLQLIGIPFSGLP
jgi:hypothetical protein